MGSGGLKFLLRSFERGEMEEEEEREPTTGSCSERERVVSAAVQGFLNCEN